MQEQDITLAQRFKALLEYYRFEPYDFATKIGDPRSEKIKRILNGKGFPSFDMLLRIKKTFPEINLNWLIRGTGYMIQETKSLGGAPVVVKSNADSSVIPMVGVARRKEYIQKTEDPLWILNEPSAEYALYNDHTYRDFEIGSHDMEPMMLPGDLVRGVHVNDQDLVKIGRFYVVVTGDAVHIRRLASLDDRSMALAAMDEDFPVINVLRSEVRELWKIVEIRKRTL